MKKRASKILIVDDYHSNRVSLERLLKPIENIEIFHAESGNQALSLIIHNQFSLILLDVNMPEMDGYVLTRHIKEDVRFKGIPVVMHSSLSSVANKKLGQQVGVDAYVGKFHPEELAQMVTSMLHPA